MGPVVRRQSQLEVFVYSQKDPSETISELNLIGAADKNEESATCEHVIGKIYKCEFRVSIHVIIDRARVRCSI